MAVTGYRCSGRFKGQRQAENLCMANASIASRPYGTLLTFYRTTVADDDRAKAVELYVSEYRKAIEQNLDGVVGPVVRPQG
jgi:hypothetical protein